MSESTPRVLGGRYEVGELIGRGGMAEVHLGHDTRLGRTVAIKMLRADLARDTVFLTRFRREAQSAAGLTHHAIVAVYDSGEDVFIETGGARLNIPYIVMEHIDGKTLRQILDEEGKLSSDEAARIIMGVLSALEYSHENGIVHRDIKPGNIMLTRGGSVKVMDFGIARALADTGATMTSAQAVVGTARYLSPEQAQGETVDARSDLYSAGCVLFELLTGRTPFVGEAVSLVYQHITDPPKLPSSYEHSVPRGMDAVTVHALEKPRGARYQSAGEFRADLQTVRTGQPPSAAALASLAALDDGEETMHAGAVPAPVPGNDYTAELAEGQGTRRRTGLWIVAAISALLAILGIGYLVMNNGISADTATVPKVTQMQIAQAKKLLASDGFRWHITQVRNDAGKGTVLGQDPKAGASAKVGAAVDLSVSGGPGTITIPNVAGMSQSQATAVLNKRGFHNITVSSTQIDGTSYPANQVAKTDPAIGNAVDPSSTITLVISSGQVKVPSNLVGKDAAQANSELAKAHLTGRVIYQQTHDPSRYNHVLSVPLAGQMVAIGTEVKLIVGSPAASTAPPPPPVTVTVTPPPPPSPTSTDTPSSPSSSSTPPSHTATGSPPHGSPPHKSPKQ